MGWKDATAVLVALLLAGCSGGDGGSGNPGSNVAIAAGPLSGSIDGAPWSLAAAETDAFLSEGESTYWANLYAEAVTACAGAFSDRYIILNVPRSPGDHALGLSLTATFVIERDTTTDNLATTEGHILIDEITADRIRGGAYLNFDAQNTVNGRFEITMCP